MFDFHFNHQILILILMDYIHGPSVSKEIICSTFFVNQIPIRMQIQIQFQTQIQIQLEIQTLVQIQIQFQT